MACPSYRAFKNEKLCGADMLNELVIKRRDISFANEDAVTIDTVDLFGVWAACETQSKNVHMSERIDRGEITHRFYVRYDEWVDCFSSVRVNLEKHYFVLDGENYRIHRVEQVNQRKNVICLYCQSVVADFDLDAEYALTDFSGVRLGVITYDPVSGDETVTTVNYSGKGIFAQYATQEIDNENILRTDIKFSASIYQMNAVPKVTDHISDGLKNFKVINVMLDHITLKWVIQLRLT